MSEELPDGVFSCPDCGAYASTDRELAPMPAGPLTERDGADPEEPRPVIFGSDLCQPCDYHARAARMLAVGSIVEQGECAVCDNNFWAKPTLDPGGPVGRHKDGLALGHRPHCTCGMAGCGSTD